MMAVKTGERMEPELYRSEADYILYLRHLFAYETAAARLHATDSVLDIGCGAGYGTRLLSHHARHVTGVDVSADAVAAAGAAFGSPTCDFLVYDGTRLPFDSGRFDAATSFQTIEHVQDDAGFVAEAARVLRPGATFVLTTPNRATRLREGQRPWNRFHVREYSSGQLESLLLTGFSEVEMLGVRASGPIEAIEQARVASAQRLVTLDPLGIRHLVATPVMALLARLRPSPKAGSWPHAVSDFFATPADRDRGCDLLAICRR
jgi:SAM-dependent methyltransferase